MRIENIAIEILWNSFEFIIVWNFPTIYDFAQNDKFNKKKNSSAWSAAMK